MQLQRAQQLSKGIRILSTGDLQISIAHEDRLKLLEYLYSLSPDYIIDIAFSSGNYAFCAEVDKIKDRVDWNHEDEGGLARLEYEVLAPYSEHGDFDVIQPEELAALTDATIIGIDAYVYTDTDRTINPEGKFFWYPDYAIKSFVDELLINGETIFKGA